MKINKIQCIENIYNAGLNNCSLESMRDLCHNDIKYLFQRSFLSWEEILCGTCLSLSVEYNKICFDSYCLDCKKKVEKLNNVLQEIGVII